MTRAELEDRAHQLAAEATATRTAWVHAQARAELFAWQLVTLHGWSQRDAAAHCGIDRRALRRLTGEYPVSSGAS